MLTILVIILIVLIAIIVLLITFLKKSQITQKQKKLIFSLVSTFLVFPMPVPAVFTAVLMPNIAFAALLLTGGLLSIMEGIAVYYKLWLFVLPSFVITFGLLWLISNMIFFERWDKKKN